jgi:hypothetical protein
MGMLFVRFWQMDLEITNHSNVDTSGFNSLQERFTNEDWRGFIFHMVSFIFVFAFNAYILDGFQVELMEMLK